MSMLSSNEVSSSMSPQRSRFVPEKDSSGHSFAKLRCQVKKEDVKVNWLRDETEITRETQPEKYNILENGRERILVVNDVRDDDAGEYVCQSGKYRVTLYLNINEEEPSAQLYKTTSSLAGDDDSELFFREDVVRRARSSSSQPSQQQVTKRALTYVKDVYVNEGVRCVELKCQVRTPDKEVEWVRNNKPIDRSSNKYEVISRGCERALLIKNPNRADNGEYTCQTGSHKVIELRKCEISLILFKLMPINDISGGLKFTRWSRHNAVSNIRNELLVRR